MKKSSQVSNFWPLMLLGLLLFHLFLLVSTRFTAWPEMLFWPYLLIKGWLPYQDIAIVHSPLLVLALSFFYKIVGIGIIQQQIASWSVVLLSSLLLFITIKNFFSIKKALLSIIFYILLQVYYEGNGIWFDHALVLFVILIFFLLQKKRMFLAGIAWGLALATKQTAFWFILPILLSRPSLSFFKGVFLTAVIFFSSLAILGIADDFYRWGIVFGIGTLSRLPGQINPPNMREFIASLIPFLAIAPFSGKFLWPWLVAGSMGIMPRFEFFHFQPALPFLALSYAKAVDKKYFIPLLIIVSILITRGTVRSIDKPIRFYEENDKKVIQIVKERVSPEDVIFVTGYWDNLYSFTNTLPAIRPFIPQLSWYLNQPGITEEIISDLEKARPKIVVRKKESGRINEFISNNYNIVDTVSGVEIMEIK